MGRSTTFFDQQFRSPAHDPADQGSFEKNLVFVIMEIVDLIERSELGVFESYSGRCWKAREYRRWAEEGLIGEIEDPFEAVKWQQVLGGEGFLRKLKDQWKQRVERPKNYGQKKSWSAVGAEQILERVSKHFDS